MASGGPPLRKSTRKGAIKPTGTYRNVVRGLGFTPGDVEVHSENPWVTIDEYRSSSALSGFSTGLAMSPPQQTPLRPPDEEDFNLHPDPLEENEFEVQELKAEIAQITDQINKHRIARAIAREQSTRRDKLRQQREKLQAELEEIEAELSEHRSREVITGRGARLQEETMPQPRGEEEAQTGPVLAPVGPDQVRDYQGRTGGATHRRVVLQDSSPTQEAPDHITGKEGGYYSYRNSNKSGIVAKAQDHVIQPQLWPHIMLQDKDLAFKDIDFRGLVAGELEIVTATHSPTGAYISQTEKSGRLLFLKHISYLLANYKWELVREVYADILRKIELGYLGWDFTNPDLRSEIQWAVTNRLGAFANKNSNATSNKRASQGGKSDKVWWCREYQFNDCTLKAPHSSSVQGRQVSVLHICAKCYIKDKIQAPHRELSDDCPNRTRTGNRE